MITISRLPLKHCKLGAFSGFKFKVSDLKHGFADVTDQLGCRDGNGKKKKKKNFPEILPKCLQIITHLLQIILVNLVQ